MGPEQSTNTPGPQVAATTNKPHSSIRLGLILGGLLVFLIIIGWLASLLGYFYVGVKTPQQRVQLATRVCDSSMVAAYNKLNFPLNTTDKQSLQTLVKKISATAGNEADPTCQTILFMAAYQDFNVNSMQAAYTHINDAYKKGFYVDSNLQVGFNPQTMQSVMKEVKGN